MFYFFLINFSGSIIAYNVLLVGKSEGGRRRGRQTMRGVGWHHRLDGHALEEAPGAGDGQGSLACCSPWSRKELDTTE